ncbi:MAG: heparinase II/III family protein [Actinobacteria bacterium]|nr:heparinase II/III family protein [Actinomycetota bacterium]
MSVWKRPQLGRKIVVTSLVLGLAGAGLTGSPASGASLESIPTRSTTDSLESRWNDSIYAEPDPGALPEFTEPGILQNRSIASRAASQCQYARWSPVPTDAAEAARIMSGWVQMSSYGKFRLKRNPSWRYTPTLDHSGNGHMHSLYWALPLLRHGLQTNNRAMVKRFYQLIFDWIRDNPPNRPRQWIAYGQIESGFRMLSLSCALAGPVPTKKKRRILVSSMRTQANVARKRWVNYNNVSFLQAVGIFAVGCSLGQRRTMKVARKLMGRTVSKLVAADGSVREGSLGYGRNVYLWTQQEMARMRACGMAPGPKLRRSNRIPDFLADGARPDSRYEALGDSGTDRVLKNQTPADSALRYVATRGAEGRRPNLYRTYQAGFVFGHSGFGQDRRYRKETYYSVRTGPGPASEYHAHYDAAALTVASRGSQLLFDTGPYRYIKSSAATFIRGRSAHNNISLNGRSARGPRPVVAAAVSSPDGDLTSIVDRAYAREPIRRTIWYDRLGDFFVVMDDIVTRKNASFYANWNVGRDRKVTLNGQEASTDGPGANVSIINVGSPVSMSSVAGSRSPWRGWNSTKYAELVPAASVRAHASSPTARLVTVIVPRSAGVAADTVSATGTLTAIGARVTPVIGGVAYPLEISRTGVRRL